MLSSGFPELFLRWSMHELPKSLREAITEIAQGEDRKSLIQAGQRLSVRYREEKGERRRLRQQIEAVAYACARMPATYAALHAVFTDALRFLPPPQTVLDCGAGTGAAMHALWDLTCPQQMRCIEKEEEMRHLGRKLAEKCGVPAVFEDGDLRSVRVEPVDWIVCGYVLGELEQEDRERLVQRLWESCKVLILVEPGTPEGYECLQGLLQSLPADTHAVAPCKCAPCPLRQDWCHFSVRVQRTALHKQIKGGDAPYEDEKYTYLVLSRQAQEAAGGRVLRHPRIEPGRITLSLCTQQGLEERTVTKKDLLWKQARKCEWGDLIL